MIWLKLTFQTIVLILLLGFIYTVGPPIESSVFPILDAKIVLGRDSGGYQAFTIEANKLRGDCHLINYGAEWRFDHATMATGLANANGDGVRPSVPLVTASGYILGPFYALVPTTARLRPEVSLAITFYYDCHPFWHTVYRIETPVELTPVTVSIPPAPIGQ